MTMKIAIDGMGGDNAPAAVVEGVIQALKDYESIEFYITGPEDKINAELSKYDYSKDKVKVIDAKEVISTNEHPVMAVRRKKDSSIVKALNLVKDKTCDAIISAGSTGAFLAGCTLIVGRIKGVERPALSPIMPGRKSQFMIVDVGANVDCKPQYLVQFAKMGEIYYEHVFNVKKPSVGLINIGEEEEKGNDLAKSTYQLLKNEESLNFVSISFGLINLFNVNSYFPAAFVASKSYASQKVMETLSPNSYGLSFVPSFILLFLFIRTDFVLPSQFTK